jgi:4-hydroxy-3-polyprenylbenzoate decarboxylase
MIHEMTKPMVPVSLPGVKAMHAVDAAGVHPLLLAIGSERYIPYAKERVPQEILTQANSILGFNQASLAKYLLIAARQDDETLDCHNEMAFFMHVLERVNWSRDLHFQTKTTIDTLDYSGESLNSGSKLVIAVAGGPVRSLSASLPVDFAMPSVSGLLPSLPKFLAPGILVISASKFMDYKTAEIELNEFCSKLRLPNSIPLVVIVDDSAFAVASLANWLWVTFTRSNPSRDIYGAESFTEYKHWGCRGSLVIDARIKPHHAPPLIEDPVVTQRVEDKFSWIWN